MGGRGGLRDVARRLRRDQTEAEKALWHLLRAKRFAGWKWRRQYPIGPFIVDFACPMARLIVEADGGQHGEAADEARDAWLSAHGWRVLRFWNNDILSSAEGVALSILSALPPLPPIASAMGPSLSREGRGVLLEQHANG